MIQIEEGLQESVLSHEWKGRSPICKIGIRLIESIPKILCLRAIRFNSFCRPRDQKKQG